MGGVSLWACVRVSCFAAAAVERGEPGLAERPLAVLHGTPPAARVADASVAARERGVEPGMTEAAARARCPALVTRPLSEAQVTAARHALLEAALAVSPRIEDTAPGLVHVDASGLDRLVGDAAAVGARLVRQARTVGLPARVGLATGRTVARLAARWAPGVTIVPAGQERAWLAPVPLHVLDLPAEVEAALARWGVATLGELAALPRDGLAERLGGPGLRAHDLARGLDPDPFRPWVPPPFWEEAQEFEWEIDAVDALLVPMERALDRLCARLDAAQLSADTLGVGLALASGARHERVLALAHPTREAQFLLMLVRLDLEARPPGEPVTGVAVRASPVPVSPAQGGLWGPVGPAHRDLGALLARLAALVGPDNLGSPVPADSHRPDAFALARFAGAREPGDGHAPAPGGGHDSTPAVSPPGRLMLRRLRPPRGVEVETASERPCRVHWGGAVFRVLACAGPWPLSGEWWDARGWAREEWDLLLGDGTLCRLARDRASGAWRLDGIYD